MGRGWIRGRGYRREGWREEYLYTAGPPGCQGLSAWLIIPEEFEKLPKTLDPSPPPHWVTAQPLQLQYSQAQEEGWDLAESWDGDKGYRAPSSLPTCCATLASAMPSLGLKLGPSSCHSECNLRSVGRQSFPLLPRAGPQGQRWGLTKHPEHPGKSWAPERSQWRRAGAPDDGGFGALQLSRSSGSKAFAVSARHSGVLAWGRWVRPESLLGL